MSLLIHGDSEFSAMITLTVFIKSRYSCTKYSLFCQVMATTAECSHILQKQETKRTKCRKFHLSLNLAVNITKNNIPSL